MSIDRRFSISATAALFPVLLLCGWLVVHEWRAYVGADDALRAFEAYRAGLEAVEKVSAERGPTNSLLGQALPIPQAMTLSLRRARDDSDARIEKLLAMLQADRCQSCVVEPARIAEARSELADARANADRLIDLPLASRRERALTGAVDRMIGIVPQFAPAINALAANVVKGDAGALNCLILATLSADLREYAGQLGSHFTAALTARRPLDEDDQLAIERTEGRIDQLRALIDAHVRGRPALNSLAFDRMNREYFGVGIAYITDVRRLATRAGGAGISPGQLANRYVPQMRSISAFRDQVLDLAQTEVRRHREEAMALLAGSALASFLLIAALLSMVMLFRRRVIRPLLDATRVIGAIANGDLTAEVPAAPYRDEVKAMFDAIDVLKANSVERDRLERERASLIYELKTMAETDFLTRLLNRRAFESRARATCAEQNAAAPELALIMFDLDHFKKINDTYGHDTGDRALQIVATLCRETCRPSDIVARWGGEEFAVLSRVHDAAQALAIADRLRRRIRETRIPFEGGEGFTMTASFGVAFGLASASACDSGDVGRLFRRADRLLYQAKEAGRDRVVADPTTVLDDAP
ncbi:GGDEF domain-containing protein [Paraburkholderia dilworthii]|uniref:diguanylate cyclase n=1 Tax=Paraburkholderia dilworthii TaxID=948106 RepID=A0ABW9D6J5_9BURK